MEDRLLWLMDVGGVDVAELAALAMVSKETIRCLVKGIVRRQSLPLVTNVATVFGVSLDYLVKGDGRRPAAGHVRSCVAAFRASRAAA